MKDRTTYGAVRHHEETGHRVVLEKTVISVYGSVDDESPRCDNEMSHTQQQGGGLNG